MQTTEIDYSRKWYVMAAVGASTFLETIDVGIVTLALPTLVRAFQVDFAIIQWIILAFVLTQATLMLVVGRLGDMIGKKPVFVTGFIVAGIGAFLCGLAPSIGWLIAFRVVQATGTAMSLALTMGIATEAFPPSQRGTAMGSIAFIVSIGIVLGPLLGGVILDLLSWRWMFFSITLIAAIGLPIAIRYLPSVRLSNRQPFDYLGAVTFFLFLLTFLLAMTYGQQQGYGQPLILALFGLSTLFILLFIGIELRVTSPVAELRLFLIQAFTLNLLLRLISFVVFVGISLLLPFYLEDILGYDSQRSGILLTVIPIAFGLSAPISGVLADRFDSQSIKFIGLILLLAGAYLASTLTLTTSTWGYVLRVLPFGAGMGVFQSPNNSIIMGSVPRERLGMASSLLSVTRTFGRSIGISLIGALWSSRVFEHAGGAVFERIIQAPVAAQLAGMQDTFLAIAGCIGFGLILSLWDWWRVQG